MNNDFISIMTTRIVQGFDPLQIILFGSSGHKKRLEPSYYRIQADLGGSHTITMIVIA